MKVYIGADHRGFNLKEALKPWLIEQGYEVVDCGNTVFDPSDDFPDFSFAVADKVAEDLTSMGIIICGSGGGATIAANKVTGIRCTMGVHVGEVRHNRVHNNINMLSLGADHTTELVAKKLVEAFLTTPFGPEERFVRRLEKIKRREDSKTVRQ